MAITVVGTGTEGSGTSGTTVTAGLPAGIQANDVLVAVGSAFINGGTVTMPAEWTRECVSTSTNGNNAAVWWHRYDGVTPPSPVATFSGSSGDEKSLGITAFRGVKTSGNPFNVKQSATMSTSTSSSISSSALTTTATDTMVIHCVAGDAARNYTPPSGFTAAFEDTAGGTNNNFQIGNTSAAAVTALMYKTQAAAGSTGSISTTTGTVAFGTRAWLGALEPAPTAVARSWATIIG